MFVINDIMRIWNIDIDRGNLPMMNRGILDANKLKHIRTQYSVGCDYLTIPEILASGTKVLIHSTEHSEKHVLI